MGRRSRWSLGEKYLRQGGVNVGGKRIVAREGKVRVVLGW